MMAPKRNPRSLEGRCEGKATLPADPLPRRPLAGGALGPSSRRPCRADRERERPGGALLGPLPAGRKPPAARAALEEEQCRARWLEGEQEQDWGEEQGAREDCTEPGDLDEWS